MPVFFSIAHDPGWMRPLTVLGAYGVSEIAANSLEPIVYGRTIGVSSIGLLVSAMFWTWLWGGLGLFLATPLTVCLVVAGKYVPSLSFLNTMLGEGIQVDEDLRFYQRLQSRDLDGAIAVLDQALERKSFGNVCDQIVIPALSRTDQDRAAGVLELSDVVFHWRVIQEWLDDLTENKTLRPSAPTPTSSGRIPGKKSSRSSRSLPTAWLTYWSYAWCHCFCGKHRSISRSSKRWDRPWSSLRK